MTNVKMPRRLGEAEIERADAFVALRRKYETLEASLSNTVKEELLGKHALLYYNVLGETPTPVLRVFSSVAAALVYADKFLCEDSSDLNDVHGVYRNVYYIPKNCIGCDGEITSVFE
jgi:hypothetical protein